MEDIQNEFTKSISKIEAIQEHKSLDSYDSLKGISHLLSTYLKATLPFIAESLTARFQPPSFSVTYQEGTIHEFPKVWIATSADHKMRIWTWNTWTGGSMPALENLVEFQTENGIKVIDLKEDFDWGPKDRGGNHLFDTIFTVQSRKGRTYYMPRGKWQGDGRNSGAEILAFTIEDTLNTEARIFEQFPKDISYHSEEKGLQYEISRAGYDCPIPKIKMNLDCTKLWIQHIGNNKKGHDILSNKWDVYRFDGEQFVYKGISK